MKKPYLIRTPAFDPRSGGIRVMWALYGHLLAKGQVAFTNTQIDIPSIGIYPEIYRGNDMVASKVVRYILQKPGMMGTTDETGQFRAGLTQFDKSDEIYVFSKIYDEWGVDDDHILFIPVIDLHTFYDQKRKRTKVAYYVGKGQNKFKHPVNAIEITREMAIDQQVLANTLNECQQLFVYDPISAIMEVARLCGCGVNYYGDIELDRLKLYEPGMNGLAYYDSADPKLWTSSFREHYKSLIRNLDDKLYNFIDNTQK